MLLVATFNRTKAKFSTDILYIRRMKRAERATTKGRGGDKQVHSFSSTVELHRRAVLFIFVLELPLANRGSLPTHYRVGLILHRVGPPEDCQRISLWYARAESFGA